MLFDNNFGSTCIGPTFLVNFWIVHKSLPASFYQCALEVVIQNHQIFSPKHVMYVMF